MKLQNQRLFLLTILLVLAIFQSCSAEIDATVSNTAFGMTAIKYEFIITLISLFSGIFCLIGGFVLIILGITGNLDWIVEVSGFSSKLINASPGIILMIIGLIIVIKSKVRIKNKGI